MPVLNTPAGLVARCRAGDDDAWREPVDRHARYVHAIAVRAYRLQPADAWEEIAGSALDGMDPGTAPSETEVAELTSELPPAPASWVRAAVALPRLRREVDRLAGLCAADAEIRAHILADLESALRDAGLRATPVAVRLARERLQ